VPDESTVILTTSSEGTGTKPRVLDEVKGTFEAKVDAILDRGSKEESEYSEEETIDEEIEWLTNDEEEEKKDDDEDDKSIDIEKNDDEETDDEFHGDEYVHDDGDLERAGKLPLTISSLSVSSSFGNRFLNHSSDTSLIGTIKEFADTEINSLLDIQIQQKVPHIQSLSILTELVLVILGSTVLSPIHEIPPVTPTTTSPPPPSVSTISHVLQQTTTPILTPLITTVALTATTVSNLLRAIAKRVSVLEKDVQDLKQVDHSAEILASFRSQVPPVIKNEQAEKQQMPKYSVKSSDKAILDEYDQKSALFQTMTESKSFKKHPAHKALYHALMESLLANEEGMDQGVKTKRRTQESESSKKSSASKDTYKGNSPPKTSKSDKPVHAEESVVKPTKEVNLDDAIENMVNDADQPQDDSEPQIDRSTLDELMDTPIDFSNFAKNSLKLDKITKADLVGPVYNLLKGTCHPGHLTVVAEYFFNNDLEYLKSTNSKRKYTTSITKTKPPRYELVGIEDMILKQWSTTKVGYNRDAECGIKHWEPKHNLFYRSQLNRFSKHDVFSHQNILSVVSVKVKKLHGYGYLEEIMKSHHQEESRRCPIGCRKLPKKLNITKPQKDYPGIASKELYTPSYKPPGVVYEDLCLRKRLMRADELYNYNKDMPRRKWYDLDKRQSGIMVDLIDKQMLKRRILRNLERLVGGRELEIDYRLMQRTV
ncbi:hypothetical protein Tco_0767452, partial [Tanacetum coccineum]